MDRFRHLLFGPQHINSANQNVAFLILRFFVGLALCTVFEKLFPRDGVWGPQQWFVDDVALSLIHI